MRLATSQVPGESTAVSMSQVAFSCIMLISQSIDHLRAARAEKNVSRKLNLRNLKQGRAIGIQRFSHRLRVMQCSSLTQVGLGGGRHASGITYRNGSMQEHGACDQRSIAASASWFNRRHSRRSWPAWRLLESTWPFWWQLLLMSRSLASLLV